MKCLRCGYCCKHYCVVIVADKAKGPSEDNLTTHMGDGTPCPHLRGDRPGEYSCDLHDEEWYPETPCFQHSQFERSSDTPCRMGVYILAQEKED